MALALPASSSFLLQQDFYCSERQIDKTDWYESSSFEDV